MKKYIAKEEGQKLTKDNKQTQEVKDTKDTKEIKDTKKPKEPMEPKEPKEQKEGNQDNKQPTEEKKTAKEGRKRQGGDRDEHTKPTKQPHTTKNTNNKNNNDKDNKHKDNDNNNNKDNKDNKQKKQHRENKPYNKPRFPIVTLQTPLPVLPAKEPLNPSHEEFIKKLDALKTQRESVYNSKDTLHQTLKSNLANFSESKKTQWQLKGKYASAIKGFIDSKRALREEIDMLSNKKKDIETSLDDAKTKVRELQKPKGLNSYSKQALERQLQNTERELTTAVLTKVQQSSLNTKIQSLTRHLATAKEESQISSQITRLKDQENILYGSVKDIRKLIDDKYKQLKAIQAQIDQVTQEEKGEIGGLAGQTPEEIKAAFTQSLAKAEEEIAAINNKIAALKQSHNKALKSYNEYQNTKALIAHIVYHQQRIKADIEYKQKKQRQREERQRQRKKQQQERERKRIEWEQRKEERQKEEEERKRKREEDKEKFISRGPNHQKIQFCTALQKYCTALLPQNIARNARPEDKPIYAITELKAEGNKEWEKELKKGAQVIVPKKQDRSQEERKGKQKVVKAVEPQEQTYHHTDDIVHMFDALSIQPPTNPLSLTETLAALSQKYEVLQNPTEEEVKAFRETAAEEFQRMHRVQRRRDDGQDRDRGDRGDKGRNYKDREPRQPRNKDDRGHRQEKGKKRVFREKVAEDYDRENNQPSTHHQYDDNSHQKEEREEAVQSKAVQKRGKDKKIAQQSDFPNLE